MILRPANIFPRYSFWFLSFLAVEIVRMKPWNWASYPLTQILLGLALAVPIAALVALAPWLGARFGMKAHNRN